MSISIRLSRGGAKKRPYYRIVVANSRSPRDGKYLEQIGTYTPLLAKDSGERVKITEEAVKWLEPRLIGRDPAGIEAHWNRLYYEENRWRDGSVLMTALSAIDIALWDIEGKRLARSLLSGFVIICISVIINIICQYLEF